ncbi:ABC-three component system protein [Spirillospora sp. CA-294931]|uniref:ABC-three component system protein n=1 Tax=Spirillospora sp. CA-294931 TaxID=3240042 RepID=UPI003D945552
MEFTEGLNLLVARSTAASSSTDSRNGVGKSSLVELLHFLLGARADRNHLANRASLRRITFTLNLDWPAHPSKAVSVSRSASGQKVTLDPCLRPPSEDLFGEVFADDPCAVPLGEWQTLIESVLFGLVGEHPGVSGRTLLSFLIRKVGDHGFNEAIRSFARQPEAQATPSLAYLLGLDSDLAARYQDLGARKATRDQLKKAVDDPVWGRVVGKSADLRGQIAIVASKIDGLNRQISEFRVVPQYEELKNRADELARRIQELGAQDAVDRRNLDHLERAVAEAVDPEVRYLRGVYDGLGIELPERTLRRFDDVREFHAAVVANRRIFLEQEIRDTRARLEAREAERGRLGEEQSRILKQLNEGGALTALTTLQKALGQEEAALGALQHRLEAAQAVESSNREIETARLELTRAIETDLQERHRQTDQATVLFNDFAQRLYGTTRPSYLKIEPGRSSLKITPKIDSDVSQGINRMAIFCFDLTLAVIAYRAGRGPDFLVHDSHLFDGVDDRQLHRALQIAADTMDAENMQYIVTINEDDLAKAQALGFDADPYIIEPLLTDAYETGGLFGFRFDR